MKWIGLILGVVYVVYQVVTVILNSAAKRQELERLQGAVKPKRQSIDSARPARTKPASETESRFLVESARTRSEAELSGGPADLAARRKAQLEQLRQRRAAGPAPQPGKGRLGPVTATTFSAPPTPKPIPTIGMGMPGVLTAEQVRRTKTDAERARQRAQELFEKKREQEARSQATFTQRESAETQEAAPPAISRRKSIRGGSLPTIPRTRSRVKDRMRDPLALRELYVMKELLDPPVAFRERFI